MHAGEPSTAARSALRSPYSSGYWFDRAGRLCDGESGIFTAGGAPWPSLAREGVTLAYEEAGSGDPPFLFIHGVACDRSYFAPQAEQFRRGHRTVSVDLRGHGESDKPHQEYTMSGFADDLAWLCEQLNVERPVVVGHSLGGVVAMVLAAQHPDLPTAIVMLDAPIAAIDGPPSAADPRRRIIDALKGPGYAAAARSFADRLFLPTDDTERRARITGE